MGELTKMPFPQGFPSSSAKPLRSFVQGLNTWGVGVPVASTHSAIGGTITTDGVYTPLILIQPAGTVGSTDLLL